ncbi:flavin-containing monooxygenase [Streptomyces sp. NEAU-W12]|uniref:flavin-containing monooxygenase n=1 Tax=Streptomyces sp. NEAU-W12 TaxID=2994668 RepID=UPI00224A616A|nr:NAD(P)/FAD-dependent oxidoreductase [Streptomyces sp. NEAU-W12]MCX2928035.1 NAD(P)/FAD-dependent oxidoreductase [Streptomyces sp. NEAU-W12]MCX2928251.1 NAD(P)/FAD-dependent oxidoreductase [Streptomyces sp. NEAU-W12]
MTGQSVHTDAVIIGAGMSGLCQAVELSKSTLDFVVLEKADGLGGTWRYSTYPGASCDVESHLYSYSFERNPGWSSTYARQPEILAYLHRMAERRGLLPHIRFGTDVTGARWETTTGRWTVTTADGTAYVSRFLILGVGGLHMPLTPALPGSDEFTGAVWHSSGWNHDVDLTGKHVTVVGTGASGVQIIPEVAARAARLTVFQRTPAWVLPKLDTPHPAWRKKLFRALPWALALHRLRIDVAREKRGIGFHHRPDALRVAEDVVRHQIDEHIDDPDLRRRLTPAYRFGCKRVLLSNDYYRSLNAPHVQVVSGSPVALRPQAVVDETGADHETDVIIYATGFDLAGSFNRIHIEGTGGRLLKDTWHRTGMSAYNGVAVSGFPNMFLLLGPNGFVPYTGAVQNIEAQARYVIRAMRAVRSSRARALDVRPAAEQDFQGAVRARYDRTVWAVGGCRSQYASDSAAGTVLWPDSTWAYRWRLRRVRKEDYEFQR